MFWTLTLGPSVDRPFQTAAKAETDNQCDYVNQINYQETFVTMGVTSSPILSPS